MKRPRTPVHAMIWALSDRPIEDHAFLRASYEDIRAQGFEGIELFVRCSRYTWADREAMQTMGNVNAWCRRDGLTLWIGADPRAVAGRLSSPGHAMPVLVYGDATVPRKTPNLLPLRNGRFRSVCRILSRPTHILHDETVTYRFDGVERIYAVRLRRDESTVSRAVDITTDADWRVQSQEERIAVEGEWRPPAGGDWRCLVFYRFRTNLYDFADPAAGRAYAALLRSFPAALVPDGILWDEPGYLCQHGVLPWSEGIRRRFRARGGGPFWLLALESAARDHIPVRVAFYRAVQSTVLSAQASARREAERLWGRPLVVGMHDTWRWESADMSDMNHGSLDLWRALPVKRNAFVDLGSVHLLRRPSSGFYANLAMVMTVGSSLARRTPARTVYNNLWTAGEDAWQKSILRHCIRVLAVFGHRWSAHIYGPAGTRSDPSSFLGLPYTPGYPRHSTWKEFPALLSLLAEHERLSGGALPDASVLLVYPIEAMYARGPANASRAARDIFRLVLALTDAHVTVDVASPSAFESGVTPETFARRYAAVVLPHASVMPHSFTDFIASSGVRCICVFGTPRWGEDGRPLRHCRSEALPDIRSVVRALRADPRSRPVQAPARCWVTTTRIDGGILLSLCPARHGYTYEGCIRFRGVRVLIPATSGLYRILIREDGTAEHFPERTE
ncbi:MAG: hypothetical protein QHI48_08285 [Bacteroidota bacterium]|nr:hypothetical protein [Bacteroidota bacterium]